MKQNGGLKLDDYGKLLKQWHILASSAETNADIQKVEEMKRELDNLLRYNQHEKDQHNPLITLSPGIIPSNYYSTNKDGIPKKKNSFNNYNINQKSVNHNVILKELSNKYRNSNKYDLARLNRLASIGASILSIKKMPNGEPKKILLNALRETIKQSERILVNYPEFQEYKIIIFPQ